MYDTFALEALSVEAVEQRAAVAAEGWSSVRVHLEPVRYVDVEPGMTLVWSVLVLRGRREGGRGEERRKRERGEKGGKAGEEKREEKRKGRREGDREGERE